MLQSGGSSFAFVPDYQLHLYVDHVEVGGLDLDGASDLSLYGIDCNGASDLMVTAMYQSAMTPGAFGAPVRID